jgi:sugar/nucleoside kinase (ribokinase family)
MQTVKIKTLSGQFIVCVGAALVDILIREKDHFLEKTGATKGGMTLVEKSFIEQTMARASSSPAIVPGGSACNTAIGVARLGGSARFVGTRGSDATGKLFEDDLRNNHVEPLLFRSPDSPTGRVLSIITPDAQRSMFTFLGAAAETEPGALTPQCFESTAIVHLEGYLLFNEALMLAALESAKTAGAMVSLDLASFTVVEGAKAFIDHIVENYVDILIANEDEARTHTGFSDESKAIMALSRHVDLAVLKVGKRGSYITNGSQVIQIPPRGDGSAVDTTGAGDLWAAGFLFGLINRMPLAKCGEMGSICGNEVCQVVGANIPESGWRRVRESMD